MAIKGVDPDIKDVYEVLRNIKNTLDALYFEVKALRQAQEEDDE